jgi:hypothetical protein
MMQICIHEVVRTRAETCRLSDDVAVQTYIDIRADCPLSLHIVSIRDDHAVNQFRHAPSGARFASCLKREVLYNWAEDQ